MNKIKLGEVGLDRLLLWSYWISAVIIAMFIGLLLQATVLGGISSEDYGQATFYSIIGGSILLLSVTTLLLTLRYERQIMKSGQRTEVKSRLWQKNDEF